MYIWPCVRTRYWRGELQLGSIYHRTWGCWGWGSLGLLWGGRRSSRSPFIMALPSSLHRKDMELTHLHFWLPCSTKYSKEHDTILLPLPLPAVGLPYILLTSQHTLVSSHHLHSSNLLRRTESEWRKKERKISPVRTPSLCPHTLFPLKLRASTLHASHFRKREDKVEPPKTNTMYHMYTLGVSKCMHVVHSVGFAIAVGFGWFYLTK